jgi:DNA invertase Pin-like site-specific DNA recombinase
MENTKVFRAAAYLRISHPNDSGEPETESSSISNQRDLLYAYAKTTDDIEIVTEFSDDGVSGANFDRPAFKKMLEAAKSGEINCILVKDD